MTTIFITIPWFHPAYRAGGPVQSIANMVNELAEGYEFYIFCGNTDLNNIYLENIKTGQWIPYNDHTKIWYSVPYKRSEILLQQMEKTCPDFVYITGLFSWHFNIVPLLFGKFTSAIVSVRGMLHPGALAQKKIKKQLFLQLFKLTRKHKKLIFHATDKIEKLHIENVFGQERMISVAGNFPRLLQPSCKLTKQAGLLKLVSLALISPMKNHLLVLQALAICAATVEYEIYGPVKDMEYWQQCLQQIKKLPANIQVKYHADVTPEQVVQVLHHSEVFILPSRSENFGHAIIEALSAGLPVITSEYTPWNNLAAQRAGINVSTGAGALATAIDQFAEMNEATFAQYRNGAIAYAHHAIDMEAVKSQYRQMFANAAGI